MINPKSVRYIKLGEAGRWEDECITNNIIRFGFGSAKKDRYKLCRSRKWQALTESFLSAGRSKGTATRFTNEIRRFFEDNGDTLWITFVGERLWWGMLAAGPATPHADRDGVQRAVLGGWKSTDVNGEVLTKERLSGALTKLAAYRGTSCDVDVADYVVRRINGKKLSEVEAAIAALHTLTASVVGLMKLLGDRDFELLVDLVFTASGWRRQGVVGKTQKTLDLDLVLPSTNERALVQVKSKTTSKELAHYISLFEGHGPYDRMFYIFHSGGAETDDERVSVIGPEKLAVMVVEAGLTDWLIRKVS